MAKSWIEFHRVITTANITGQARFIKSGNRQDWKAVTIMEKVDKRLVRRFVGAANCVKPRHSLRVVGAVVVVVVVCLLHVLSLRPFKKPSIMTKSTKGLMHV